MSIPVQEEAFEPCAILQLLIPLLWKKWKWTVHIALHVAQLHNSLFCCLTLLRDILGDCIWLLVASSGAVGWGNAPQDSKFLVWFQILFLLSISSIPGVHSASMKNEYHRISLGGKAWPANRDDNSAVLVEPHVRLKMGAQHSILPLSLHDLLWVIFTFMSSNRIWLQMNHSVHPYNIELYCHTYLSSVCVCV